jgi:uncharacterized protein (TIGR00661 family)
LKKVFFGILNWGLGHSTRSVPIIELLITKGYEVHIGSDGVALTFLRNRFEGLSFHELPSYDASYSTGNNQSMKIALQIPKFLQAIKKEGQFIFDLHQEENFDLIISDNRFGVKVKGVKSIYITHQVNIKSSFFGGMLKNMHGKIINEFDECWVPDFLPPNNLSGSLSEATDHIQLIKYIGPLSHLTISQLDQKYDICYLLSGPEPQRSILEKKLMAAHPSDKKGVLIRGSKCNSDVYYPSEVSVLDLVSSEDLSAILSSSEYVVGRSGYSSLMDLANSHCKLLLIPTPGQTEQEYLANRLFSEHGVLTQSQSNIDLSKLDQAVPLVLEKGSCDSLDSLI